MRVKDIQENYGSGWIKIYRSLKKHWIWQDDQYFKIWIDFLFRANHQDNRILVDSDLIPLLRGSFITSLKKLAKEYHCSIGKIRHFLKILENDSMIELITTHKYTQITLCNYDSYQDKLQTERKQNETGMKSERHGNETDKELKNVKNDKKYSVRVSFNKFWELYDKKIDRKKCEPKWNRLSLKDQEEALAYIPGYKVAQPDKQFRKNPATFLNNRSWQNEIITKVPEVVPFTGRIIKDDDWRKPLQEAEEKIKKQGKWQGEII